MCFQRSSKRIEGKSRPPQSGWKIVPQSRTGCRETPVAKFVACSADDRNNRRLSSGIGWHSPDRYGGVRPCSVLSFVGEILQKFITFRASLISSLFLSSRPVLLLRLVGLREWECVRVWWRRSVWLVDRVSTIFWRRLYRVTQKDGPYICHKILPYY